MRILFLVIGIYAMNALTNHETAAFTNATIYTGSEFTHNADAFIVRDGRFSAIGTTETIKSLIDDTTPVFDLGGALVMPGFIESHAHLVGLGKSRSMLDLKNLTRETIIHQVVQQARLQPKDTWIKGRGWDQNLWPEQQFPHKDMLSSIEHPVYLTRVDGHAIWVNDAALQRAGITNDTADPVGGQIYRDEHGKATGIFIDTAMELISKHMASPSKEELEHFLTLGIEEAVSLGITSFHDAGASAQMLDLFQEYAHANKLSLRIYAMIDGDNDALVQEYLRTGPVSINDLLTIRSIKYFADGALGSRGSLLLEDYHDQPGHKGLALITRDTLATKTKQALLAGFQVATHAIGDGANRMVLDAYSQALSETNAKDARLRIEHAQLVDEADHHRFKQLGVIASMQPIHCTSDMPWVPQRLSTDRLHKRAYPWRSLLQQGAVLALGSDAPVENINPLEGIYAAVSRSDRHGLPENGFMPEEKLTLKQALNGYFSGAAFAEFAEHKKGLIKEDYLADFVVFEENILHPTKSLFLNAKPAMTVMGGKIVFQKKKARP